MALLADAVEFDSVIPNNTIVARAASASCLLAFAVVILTDQRQSHRLLGFGCASLDRFQLKTDRTPQANQQNP